MFTMQVKWHWAPFVNSLSQQKWEMSLTLALKSQGSKVTHSLTWQFSGTWWQSRNCPRGSSVILSCLVSHLGCRKPTATFLQRNKKKWGNFKTSHEIVIFCLAMLSAKLVLLHLESMDCSAAGDWTEPGIGSHWRSMVFTLVAVTRALPCALVQAQEANVDSQHK